MNAEDLIPLVLITLLYSFYLLYWVVRGFIKSKYRIAANCNNHYKIQVKYGFFGWEDFKVNKMIVTADNLETAKSYLNELKEYRKSYKGEYIIIDYRWNSLTLERKLSFYTLLTSFNTVKEAKNYIDKSIQESIYKPIKE